MEAKLSNPQTEFTERSEELTIDHTSVIQTSDFHHNVRPITDTPSDRVITNGQNLNFKKNNALRGHVTSYVMMGVESFSCPLYEPSSSGHRTVTSDPNKDQTALQRDNH